MVQVIQRLEDPGLMFAAGGIGKASEEGIAHGLVSRDRGQDEVVSLQPVYTGYTGPLGSLISRHQDP